MGLVEGRQASFVARGFGSVVGLVELFWSSVSQSRVAFQAGHVVSRHRRGAGSLLSSWTHGQEVALERATE